MNRKKDNKNIFLSGLARAIFILLFGAGALILFGTRGASIPVPSNADPSGSIIKEDTGTSSLRIGNIYIPVEAARSDSEVRKGLSGRSSLDSNRGMVFIFPRPAVYRFWMKDMKFPIDIIWINEGKVLGMSLNASDEFDPQSPRFYTPPSPVKYVLEVNAGFAEEKGIMIGDKVLFYSIEKI